MSDFFQISTFNECKIPKCQIMELKKIDLNPTEQTYSAIDWQTLFT